MSADDIANCVLDTFEELPAKRKPRARNDGAREWVPLSGIVLSKGPPSSEDGQLTCASLGTGMKCLPSSKLHLANGNVLHDWHAEVLAIRALNRFLIEECLQLLRIPPSPSLFVRQRSSHEITSASHQPFAIQDGVTIHMYCSEAPCGDASMELVMEAQEDSTPWPDPPLAFPPSPAEDQAENSTPLRGRGYFSHLGAVRLKPSRPDAPPTFSKSCTDKLAFAQVTSLLSSLTALLITPKTAYLTSLILPASQHVPSATTRAFSPNGRMSNLTPALEQKWRTQGTEYAFQPFSIQTTALEFKQSRRTILPTEKLIPSNLSAVYTPHFQETLIGGVLQGRKQFDPRGASRICRRGIWKAVLEVALGLGIPGLLDAVRRAEYKDVKAAQGLEGRRVVKRDVRSEVLKGWVRNEGDEGFGLEDAELQNRTEKN